MLLVCSAFIFSSSGRNVRCSHCVEMLQHKRIFAGAIGSRWSLYGLGTKSSERLVLLLAYEFISYRCTHILNKIIVINRLREDENNLGSTVEQVDCSYLGRHPIGGERTALR